MRCLATREIHLNCGLNFSLFWHWIKSSEPECTLMKLNVFISEFSKMEVYFELRFFTFKTPFWKPLILNKQMQISTHWANGIISASIKCFKVEQNSSLQNEIFQFVHETSFSSHRCDEKIGSCWCWLYTRWFATGRLRDCQ